MEFYANSDIGNYREQNEDFFFADGNLFIVADGMGGHAAGEIASKTAVDSFVSHFYQHLDTFNDFPVNHNLSFEENNLSANYSILNSLKKNKKTKKKIPDTESLNNLNEELKKDSNIIHELMKSSINYANRQVYNLSCAKKEYSGMGTTFTACFSFNNTAHIVHIGDSRAYIKNDNSFNLLTRDHTVVYEMYRKGLISYEDTFSHPLRNYLENVLGINPSFDFDYLTVDLKEKDLLVLCSDGLNSMIKDKEIEKIIKKGNSAKKITDALIKKAKINGGLDNITVITIIF